MAPDPLRPFTAYEMTVLRGIIDDRIAHELRRTKLWHRLSTGERFIVLVGAVVGGVLPVVELALTLTGHH